MFANAGKVIFVIGKILFWLCIAAGVVTGVLMSANGGRVEFALVYMLGGVVTAFLCAMPVCGFGKLIEDVSALRAKFVDAPGSEE